MNQPHKPCSQTQQTPHNQKRATHGPLYRKAKLPSIPAPAAAIPSIAFAAPVGDAAPAEEMDEDLDVAAPDVADAATADVVIEGEAVVVVVVESVDDSVTVAAPVVGVLICVLLGAVRVRMLASISIN